METVADLRQLRLVQLGAALHAVARKDALLADLVDAQPVHRHVEILYQLFLVDHLSIFG